MRLKQNPIVKGLVVVMVIVPLYFLATNSDDSTEKTASENKGNAGNGKPLVTENEAIAAMSGYLSTVEEEQKKLKETQVTKEEVAQIIKDAMTSNKTQTGAVDEDSLLKKVTGLIEEKTKALKSTILTQSQIKPSKAGNVNDEIPFEDAFEVNTRGGSSSKYTEKAGANSEKISWDYPVGYIVEEDKGLVDGLMGKGSVFGNKAGKFAGEVKDTAIAAKDSLKQELKPIPYATIHSDSSIHDATALTALIGRIERKGQAHDPFRFQVMLSGDTLMANGQSMPGVANAIVSGVGVGDAAFGCVRGRVTSITFNFEDGRIYNQKGTYEKPIAEVGDRWGNPCVKGVKVDDVDQYLAAQGLVAGLSNYADTIAKQQQTLTSSGNSTSLSLSGDAGKLAAGSFASGGLSKTSEILAQRYENYYEAVYVPPGEKVSLLFIADVNIDYIPTNRKVSYEENISSIAALD